MVEKVRKGILSRGGVVLREGDIVELTVTEGRIGGFKGQEKVNQKVVLGRAKLVVQREMSQEMAVVDDTGEIHRIKNMGGKTMDSGVTVAESWLWYDIRRGRPIAPDIKDFRSERVRKP